jgi:triosephosphate isomerase
VTLRTPVIAGNWKLNFGPSETAAYFESLLPRLPASFAGTVAIFPPSISFAAARAAAASRPEIRLGVQNLHWESSGAFTGEISAALAADAGATLALAGHSERRHLFGETDEEAARKARSAIDAGLTAVLCVGETIDERDEGIAFEVVERQLRALLTEDSPPPFEFLAVAYEPVWAIGTGRTATPADAAAMHERVRAILAAGYGETIAERIPILYGGSVKPGNAAELLAAPNVDGLLIGGASLDPEGFASICALT